MVKSIGKTKRYGNVNSSVIRISNVVAAKLPLSVLSKPALVLDAVGMENGFFPNMARLGKKGLHLSFGISHGTQIRLGARKKGRVLRHDSTRLRARTLNISNSQPVN